MASRKLFRTVSKRSGDDLSMPSKARSVKNGWSVNRLGRLKENTTLQDKEAVQCEKPAFRIWAVWHFHLKQKGYFSICHACKFYLGFKIRLWMLFLALLQDTHVNMQRRLSFQWNLFGCTCNNYRIIYSFASVVNKCTSPNTLVREYARLRRKYFYLLGCLIRIGI